ncbi:MAG: hypothetical protein JWN04_1220 [Myxococcaceae bacterium]|nr:hypothetical protein [Myxococcaceae bacterium]
MNTLTKRLSWALALSLGLNLFLLGFGGSRWLRMHGRHREGAALHGPHAAGVWRTLVLNTPELRAQHHTLTDARRAVGAALRAEPYDAGKLAGALSALRNTTARSQEMLHQHLLEEAPSLSREQRRELAGSRFVHAGAPDEGTAAPANERRGQ